MLSLGHSMRLRIAVCILVLSTFAVHVSSAQDTKSAGVVVSKNVTSTDVGLPMYPGAKPYHNPSDKDSDAARIAAWAGGWGLKIAATKLESADTPSKVAEFYREALGKYGSVLDCANGGPKQDDKNNSLTCGDDKPDPGGMLFKVGTKTEQHFVAVSPHGSGSVFSLVYLRVPNN